MSLSRLIIMLHCLFCVFPSTAQDSLYNFSSTNILFKKAVPIDSGRMIYYYNRSVCKGYNVWVEWIPGVEPSPAFYPVQASGIAGKIKPRLITMHGNISYDYFYRSRVDTPFAQQDLQQHTEKIYLDILLKEKYPLKLSFINRQSNSPYFNNFFDVNLRFDHHTYQKSLQHELLNKLTTQLPAYAFPGLAQAEAAVKQLTEQYDRLKSSVENFSGLQKIIEQKEQAYNRRLSEITDRKLIGQKIDSLGIKNTASVKYIDTTVGRIEKMYDEKKATLDSLSAQIKLYQSRADSIKGRVQKKLSAIKQKIYHARNDKELRKIAAENGISLPEKNKLEKHLSAIKTLGIGRSLLNYTELTAQNITISGVNIEYNPSYYVAFTAGKIDYRFRDFFNKSSRRHNQYFVMGRIGVGDKEKRALIFSVFQGRKNTLGNIGADSIRNDVNIMGYSLEAVYRKDAHTQMSAEFAKSTKPISGSGGSAGKATSVLWRFSDKSNMGINIKAQTIIPETNTKLSGFFRKTGENFQSFSLFSYHTDQTAWQARADQSLLKGKISFTAMLRRNDFTNPFTEKTYKTSALFKTVLFNLRIPKYPFVSIGYYPGTQMYLVNKEKIRENAYYIFNASVVYGYRFRGMQMHSSFIYNRYSNQATDSGFVSYNGHHYYAVQTLLLNKLQIQGGCAYNKQPELQYYTLEAVGNYELNNWLKMGVGGKHNKVTGGKRYWGQRLQVSADFKRLGGLQLQYEKSHLPTLDQTLYRVETGRVTYYKSF